MHEVVQQIFEWLHGYRSNQKTRLGSFKINKSDTNVSKHVDQLQNKGLAQHPGDPSGRLGRKANTSKRVGQPEAKGWPAIQRIPLDGWGLRK